MFKACFYSCVAQCQLVLITVMLSKTGLDPKYIKILGIVTVHEILNTLPIYCKLHHVTIH